MRFRALTAQLWTWSCFSCLQPPSGSAGGKEQKMQSLCEAVLVLLLWTLPLLLEVQPCACDEGVRRCTQVRAFLESLPAGAVVADIGCGNGAHTFVTYT